MSAFNEKTTSEEVANAFSSEINDKVVIVTGGTWGGIGADNVKILAEHGAKLVIVTGRSQKKLDETIENIKKELPDAKIRPLIMDLSSFKSIRKAAQEVNEYPEKAIDILINNAGVMACPYGKTEDGFETQFGTNHLGHFLFTSLIFKKILASPHPRVVNVTSLGHKIAPIIFEDIGFSNGAKYEPYHAYGQSKTANILFSRELSKRYNKSHGLVAFSVHPGAIGTNLARHMDLEKFLAGPFPLDYWGNDTFGEYAKLEFKSISQGGATSLVAAFDPSVVSQSGSFMQDCQVHEDNCGDHAKSLDNADKLWDLSEELIGQKF